MASETSCCSIRRPRPSSASARLWSSRPRHITSSPESCNRPPPTSGQESSSESVRCPSAELRVVGAGRQLVDQRREPKQQVGRELLLGGGKRGVERALAPSQPTPLGVEEIPPARGEA